MTETSNGSCAVLDTCCVINLGAAGDLSTMLAAVPLELWIPATAANEVLHVKELDKEDPAVLVQRILDLKPAVDAGSLQICELMPAEMSLFVQLATHLDDGEAAAIAVAKHRGWKLATDDRKARRLATEIGVALLSTPEILSLWAKETKANDATITALIRKIRTFARFNPRPDSPQATWWRKHY